MYVDRKSYGKYHMGSILDQELPIYFATKGNGIKTFLPTTSKVKTVIDSNESIVGVVFDSIRKKLYWTSYSESGDVNSSVWS